MLIPDSSSYREEGQVVVKLAELNCCLHSGSSTQAAQPHCSHANAPGVRGNALASCSALCILSAAQTILILELCHFNEREAYVPKNVPNIFQAFHEMFGLQM